MASISAAIRRLVEELAGLLESTGFGAPRRPAFALVQQGEGFRCYRTDKRRPVLVAEGDLATLQRAKLPRDMRSQPIELRIDSDSVLSKTLQLPAASQTYLDAIVRHQLERMTPWAADRVVFDYALADDGEASQDQVTVQLVATARDTYDALMGRLAAIGLKVGVIGTSEDPLDRPSPVNLLQGTRYERRDALRRFVATMLLLIAVVGLGASAYSGWRLWTLSADAATLQEGIAAARSAVEAQRDNSLASESHARLLARKREALPMILLVDALSEAIPTNTYLTELSVEEQDLRVAGFSSEAPALIGILEGAEILSEVRFAAPTTRDEETGQDRFEIVARIAAPAAAGQ